jgi:DNA-binding transcriptional MerR regulator
VNTYTIGQAAVIVGKPNEPLPTNTIRNWTKQYRDLLSADANPAPGIERRYNAQDVAILRRVHELRQDRLVYADIVADLSAHRPVAIEVLPAAPEHIDAIVELPAQVNPGGAIAPSVNLDNIELRLAAVERQGRKMPVVMAIIVAVAVLAGVVVGGVLVYLVTVR